MWENFLEFLGFSAKAPDYFRLFEVKAPPQFIDLSTFGHHDHHSGCQHGDGHDHSHHHHGHSHDEHTHQQLQTHADTDVSHNQIPAMTMHMGTQDRYGISTQ